MGDIYLKGIKYGGGTNVVPNPQEEPTDTLSTIRIGDTVFDIAGGGGLFIDTNNVIQAFTPIQDTQEHAYTATEDCAIAYTIAVSANSETFIKVDNAIIGGLYATDTTAINDVVYIKKGQTFSFQQTFTNSPKTGYTVYGIKYGSSGSGGLSSEIIPITAGDGTTSRTFTFDKTPKFIAYYWNDPVLDSGWNTTAHFVWGQEFIAYSSATNVVSINNNYQGCLRVTYNDNSITFTGGNAFSVCNTTNGSGLMYVDYGEAGGSGSSEKDISDMTWTQIISQAGGSWSSATAIPSGTTHVAFVVDYDNKAYMPQTFKLSDWDKYASILNHSLVEWGFDWKVGSSYDTVQIEYDSANHTIRTYAGYSGLTLKTYVLS